jgi:hypothetical protein
LARYSREVLAAVKLLPLAGVGTAALQTAGIDGGEHGKLKILRNGRDDPPGDSLVCDRSHRT